MRSNKGFTLIELLVTLVVGSIVTAAAGTVLLLGMRIYHQTNNMSTGQNAARIGISALQELAAEECTGIADSYTVSKKNGTLFRYDPSAKTINANGNDLLTEVEGFEAKWEQSTKLLSLYIKVGGDEYNVTIYCRTAPDAATEPDDESEDPFHEAAAPAAASAYADTPTTLSLREAGNFSARARQAFVDILLAEEGSAGATEGGQYYSEWYIGSYAENPAWSADTPWCACFISWALDRCDAYLWDVPRYAHVDKFMESFDTEYWKTAAPEKGDIVFFDWIVDSEAKPQHVGVVIGTDGETIYTIEGNVNGKVARGAYPVGDPQILGYGTLKWR